MLNDIVTNLLSDLIFVILAIVLTWIYYVLSKRKKLLKFFGIDKSRRIIIYLSKLNVLSGGSVGIDNNPRSFQGKAIANEEAKVASQLQSLFNYFLPSWGEKPGILSKLLIADIDVQILISPATTQEIEQSATFITLGSPAYNAASGYMDARQDALGKFGEVDGDGNIIQSSNSKNHFPIISSATVIENSAPQNFGGTADYPSQLLGTISESDEQNGSWPSGTAIDIPGLESKHLRPAIIVKGTSPRLDAEFGFLERIVDRDNQRNLFYAAGISELATAGAANYLKIKWEELYKKYGAHKSFLILLKFDPSDYRQSVKIHEINNKAS